MRAVLLLAFVAQEVQSADDSLEELFGRAPRASPVRNSDMDEATLGKSGHLAVHPCCVPVQSTPRVSSGVVDPLHLRGVTVGHGSRISCAARCDTDEQPALPSLPGRRHASLAALGGVMTVAAQPRPAQAVLMEGDCLLPPIENMKDGPDGMKYRDVKVGSNAGFLQEDTDFDLVGKEVKTNFVLKSVEGLLIAAKNGFTLRLGNIENLKGFDLAIMGGGDMPQMRQGGIRQVILPPELAFGKKGSECVETRLSKQGCLIPPNTPVAYIIQVTGIKTGLLMPGYQ